MDTNALRARLLELTADEYRDPALVRALPESELKAYAEHFAGFDDPTPAMRALLSMLADTATRTAGRVPNGDTGAIMCRHCGPVWIHPSIAEVLPVVGGWPRALGCPWCLVKLDKGHRMPRPPVTCADCQHFMPDKINPAQGMGRCGINATPGTTWPHEKRTCGAFKPKGDA